MSTHDTLVIAFHAWFLLVAMLGLVTVGRWADKGMNE